MFTKNSQVLGKSFLSAKDSRSFRDILLQGDCLNNISRLWCENASILLMKNDASNTDDNSKNIINHIPVSKLLLRWLGISPSSNSVSFSAEIVQGILKGTENAGKILIGTWSLRSQNDSSSSSATPVAFSVLPDGSSTSKIALPPDQDDVVLSIQSTFKLAQLWQLVLAAAFIQNTSSEGVLDKDNNNKQTASHNAAGSSNNNSDDEDEETASSSDDDTDDESKRNLSSPSSIIFELASILFPPSQNLSSFESSIRNAATRLHIFPSVVCHTEVSDRLFRGSDLMTPGTFYQGRMVKYLKPGSLTFIIPLGHYVPIAVGPLHREIKIQLPALPSVESLKNQQNKKEDDENDNENENDGEDQQEDQQLAARLQLALLQKQRDHTIYRSSMPSHVEETKAIRVVTYLGDTFWKSHEVNFLKSCTLQKYSVFASSSEKLLSSSSSDSSKNNVTGLLGQLMTMTDPSKKSATNQQQSSNNGKQQAGNDNSDEDSDDEEEEKSNNNKKKKKPIPKRAQQKEKGGNKKDKYAGKKSGNKEDNNNSAAAKVENNNPSETQIINNENQNFDKFALLRWLLSESSFAQLPPGVVLSTPPKIVVPGDSSCSESEHDDDDDDENVDDQQQETGNKSSDAVQVKDLFSRNSPFAFALLVSSVLKILLAHRNQQQENAITIGSPTAQQQGNDDTSSSGFPRAQSSSSLAFSENNNNSNTNVTEELLQAATFITISNLTKDQLPLPLSQFGARLQQHLPSTTASPQLLDWSRTKWKKPINLLREYAKPTPLSAASNKKKQQKNLTISSSAAEEIDLTNDWIVELIEKGAGNFVIQSINKASKILKDHKKSTDAVHELVRAAPDQNQQNDDNDNSDDYDDCQSRGKFSEITQGFLSIRSGLTPELDVVIFGDPEDAKKITATTLTDEKEKTRFPSLMDATATAPTAAATAVPSKEQQPSSILDKMKIDEFCSIEDAKRKLVLYARSAGLIVTKQDAADATVSASGAKPGDLKVAGVLKGLWGNQCPLSVNVDEAIKKVAIQTQKGTLLKFINDKKANQPQSEIRKGTPPYLQLSAKQVHNHWVTTVTGQFGYYLDVNIAVEAIKKKLACSARIEDAPATKTQSKSSLSLVLTGRHVEDMLNLFEQDYGVSRDYIQLVNVAQLKKKK